MANGKRREKSKGKSGFWEWPKGGRDKRAENRSVFRIYIVLGRVLYLGSNIYDRDMRSTADRQSSNHEQNNAASGWMGCFFSARIE